jgi:exonuclease SbcD
MASKAVYIDHHGRFGMIMNNLNQYMTRIIHTADWHLGARLMDCSRHAEHGAFFDWLITQLTELRPDLLIVAGDIFDSGTPPQEALHLYYQFLARLAATVRCRTLILGGNHDSPATLHAPREVLAALDIRVIAAPPTNPADALWQFDDVVICAVPFLRERDIRTAEPGQSTDDVAAAIRAGINQHYRNLHTAACDIAKERLLIATGHLTAVGSQLSPGSERSIYIGNLGAIESSCFDGFAYVALGHIHRPQIVGGNDCIRYAGSPFPLSFAEIDLPKEIRIIDISGATLTQQTLPIPVFRSLVRVTLLASQLKTDLIQLQTDIDPAFQPWIELTVSDGHTHPDLDRQVREAAKGLNLRILKILTPIPADAESITAISGTTVVSLGDLTPEEVFAARLRAASIEPSSEEGQMLTSSFDHLLTRMQEDATVAVNDEGEGNI